jgi:hypothetical protein
VVALSVENARSFIHGSTDNVPERIRVSIQLLPDGSIAIHAEGHYPTAKDATRTLRFWEAARDQFARHPLVALVGMSQPLRDMTLVAQDERLEARTTLGVEQVRLILGFARDALTPNPRSIPQRPQEPAKSREVSEPAASATPDPHGK